MTPTPSNPWHAEVGSDLVWSTPHPEDGERRIVERFFVRLTNEVTGARYVSDREFDSAADAARCLPKVKARLARGASPKGSRHWSPSYPVYGSPAYVAAEPELVAAERRADEDGSFYDGGVFGRGGREVSLH